VDVIGHEAVRQNRKRTVACGARNLLQHKGDGVGGDEDRRTLKRAERQEICVEADVIEDAKMLRLPRSHARDGAIRVPRSVRL